MKTIDETLEREGDDVSAPGEDSPDNAVQDAEERRDALAVRRPATPLVAAAAVIALLAAAAALFFVNHRHDQVAEDAETARTVGTTHVEELLSFDHEGIDAEIEDEGEWLTGDFASEYRTLMADRIAPAAKKAKVVTKARVVAGGVESAEHDRVDLILFVNVLTESAELTEPRVSGSRLRVTVENVDGDWRISALDPV